jgi:polar amino acid transport system substrate-binding protein
MHVEQRHRACVLVALSLAAACAPPCALAAAPGFVRGGNLRVCLDPSFPPMEFYAQPGDAQPVGVDVDLSQALADQWSVRLRLVPAEFTGLLPALQTGRCDAVISGVLLKPERTSVLAAVPYLSTYAVIIGRADSSLSVSGELDFAGLTLAVESGTEYAQLLEQMNKRITAAGRAPILIQTYPKETDAIQQLLVGRAAGVVSQDTEVAHRNAVGPDHFKILFRFPQPDRFAIYVRPNAADVASISAAVAQLRASGQLKALVEHWHLPLQTLDRDAR